MNRLNRDLFFRGFRKYLAAAISEEEAERIWTEAGEEYGRILKNQPELKKHKGAMVLPAVALYRAMAAHHADTEILLKYGEKLGRHFAGMVRKITSVPGVSRFIWNHVESIALSMSSEEKGYKRRLVFDPPEMYGVDILSCPYHELAKELGTEEAALFICRLDREYTQGFRKIRYDRNSALPEGAECCEYRLRYDEKKN